MSQSNTQAAPPVLHKGQLFTSVKAFQKAVRALAADEGWNVRAAETKRDYCTMRCSHESCPFYIRLRTTKGDLIVSKFNNAHNCLGLADEGQRSSSGNHELLVDTIKAAMVVDPNTSAKAIKQQLQHGSGIEAGRSAIYKAKHAILNESYGDEAESFKRLPAYIEALKAADANTHAVLELKDKKFHRVFVAPGASHQAWHHARRCVAIDATFMKTKYQNRLKLAACMDGAGSLVLFAWALTPGETADDWTWFMTHLSASLEGLNESYSTVVSDRNAQHVSAIAEVLPKANQTFCCFHIAKNIKEKGYTAAAARLFWEMVYAPTEDKFKGNMERLVELDKPAAEYVNAIDATKWATYAVKGRRYGHVTSNLAEIANVMLLEARELPPLQCLDLIYRHQMEKFFSRRVEAINCTSPVIPTEYAHLQKAALEARRMIVVCSDKHSGRVTAPGGNQYVVTLPKTTDDVGTCDCRLYQLLLRPCKHAVALLQKLKLPVHPYYHYYYQVDNWRAMYNNTLPPINITTLALNDVLPPDAKRARGRPAKERKEAGVSSSKPKSCSVCGREDHRHKDCSISWDV